MSFLNPGSLCWAGLAALIVLLYVWRFPTTTHKTATLFLWQRALERRPAWFALRFWLSLAVQLVLLLVLVVTLAQPFWTAAAPSRRTIVLLMDVSASVSAGDAAASPFQRIRAEARRLTEILQPGERMAIIAVGSTLQTVCRFADRKETLLAVIDSLMPTDGTTNMPQAVELAQRLLANESNPHTIVLTDGAFAGAAELAATEDVHVVVLRGKENNAAITRFAARPQAVDPGVFDVFVEVSNFADQPLQCELEMGMQGEPAISEPLRIAPGQSRQAVLPVPVPRDGVLGARLKTEDDLAADDQVFALVTHRERPQVLLISGESTIADGRLKSALESSPLWDVTAHAQLPATLPENPVVVFHRQVPDRLPRCPTLVIDPRQACELWDIAGVVDAPNSSVETIESVSELLADIRFQDVVVEQATRLEFKQPATALVTSSAGDPLYSLLPRPRANVLVLSVHLQKDKSDLAMRPDFSRLVDNAIRWLSRNEQPAMFAATTSQSIPVLASDTQRQITTAEGLERQLPPHQTLAVLDRVGLWTDKQATGGLTLPVNLLSRQESDLRVGADLASSPPETSAEVQQPLWMFLVHVALIGLVVEWCLFHRRIVV